MRAGRKRRQLKIERRDADRGQAAESRKTVDDSAPDDEANVATSRPEETEKEPTDSVEISGATESGATERNDEDEETRRDASEDPKAELSKAELSKPELSEGSDLDLETLAQQLEISLAGGANDAPSSSGAAPPPPEMNATPEDILGVPTQRASFEDDKSEEPEPAPGPAADVPNAGGRTAPMEGYEERAAMAKEVLRATSEQPKGHRRQSAEAGEGDRAAADDTEPSDEREQDVRFSEDLTISSRKSRRKLFKR
jgi:hypothetical protein